MSKVIFILFLASIVYTHYIHKLDGQPIEITAFTNQAKQIHIPYRKCFSVEPELPANSKFIQFTPSSLKLSTIQTGMIGVQKVVSVLDDLRSPRAYIHQNLIVLKDYALTFTSPNTIEIIKERTDSPSNQIIITPSKSSQQKKEYYLDHTYKINQINQYSRFKIYKFNQEKVVLFIFDEISRANKRGQKKMLLLDQNGYQQYEVSFNNYISYLQSAKEGEFFTAEFSDGIGCYNLDAKSKKIIELAKFDKKVFNNPNLYIVDLNIQSLHSDKIIYALDSFQGVYMLNLTASNNQPQVTLVLNQPNCNAIDSLKLNHLVLACQLGSASYIVQAYGVEKDDGTIIYEKLQPEYHFNYFNDLEINTNYFMVFSHKTLNVYWSSKQNNIPETVNTQSQLDLPGLETFYFDINPKKSQNSYLYTIEAGIMKKYLITEDSARLTVKSTTELKMKKFKISIFGNCEDLPDSLLSEDNKKELTGVTCQLQQIVSLSITEQNSPRKQDFSVSASIIVILIVVFLLIIWICLKKYKGLQKEARKILDNYKKKKPRQQLSL